MKQFRLFFALIISLMVGASNAWAAVGSTFTANTVEGVAVTYMVLTENGSTGTVQVGIDDYNHPAVEKTTTGAITIPSTVTNGSIDYEVVSLGSHTFQNCASLTSVILPNTVDGIGWSSFASCSSLTSVSIPSSITFIQSWAFYECTLLTSIDIPDNVSYIGYDAFTDSGWLENQPEGLVYAGKVAYCYKGEMPSDTSIELAEGTKGVAGFAFAGCIGLTSLTIPSSVVCIGGSAFSGCSNLSEVICYASTPPYLDEWCFYEIAPGHALYLPSEDCISAYQNSDWSDYFMKIRAIGDTSFGLGDVITEAAGNGMDLIYEITDMINPAVRVCGYSYDSEELVSLNIPESVTYDNVIYTVSSIGSAVFDDCPVLTSVTIPNSVTTIGVYAFCWCEKLASVTLGNGLETIGDGAFCSCPALTSIVIPYNVADIGDYAFGNCSNLSEVTCYAATPPSLGDDCFYRIPSNAALYVSSEDYVSDYQNSDWSDYFSKIRMIGDTSIGVGDTFMAANADGVILKYMVTGPSTVKTYGTMDNSTYEVTTCISSNSSSISVVNIPGVVTLGETSYTVTGIGEFSFMYCQGLQSVTIPDGVEFIEQGAFFQTSLTSVIIPGSVETLGIMAFGQCGNLNKVTSASVIPPTLETENGDLGAFTGIPDGVVLYVPEGCKTAYENSAWSNYFSSDNIVEIAGGKIKIAGVDVLDGIPYSNPNGVSVTWEPYYNFPIITLNNANLTYDAGPAIEINSYNRVDIYLVGDNVVSSTAPNCAAISIGTKDGVDEEGCDVNIGKVSEGYYYEPIDYEPASLTIPANTSMGIYSHDSNISMMDITADIAGLQYGVYVDGVWVMPILNAKTNGEPRRSQTAGAELFGLAESMELNMSGGNAAFMANTYGEDGLFLYSNKLLTWEPTGVTPELGECGEGEGENKVKVSFLVGNTPATSLHFGHEYFVKYTEEGVPMKFTIMDEDKKTCQVYGSYEEWTMIESIPRSYSGPLTIPETIEYNGTTYTVTQIANYAFCNSDITSVVIPENVTSIGDYAFENCYHLQAMVCLPINPPTIGERMFQADDHRICDLYVPYGCKNRYTAEGISWSSQLRYFDEVLMLEKGQTNIVTIEVEDEFVTDFSADMTDDTGAALDLQDAVAGGVYYNLNSNAGEGFDTEEGCIVINNTVSEAEMEEIVGLDFDESRETIKDQYSGLIVQVNGKGTIEIVCKTLGTGQLTVRVGDGEPIPYTTQNDESATIRVNFDVDKPTCIYIYASETSASGVKPYRMNAPRRSNEGDSGVKIYQLSVVEYVPTYNIKIGGTMVNGRNASNFTYPGLNSGTISFDPETYTLTLENVDMEGNIVINGDSGEADVDVQNLTINLIGYNMMKTFECPFYVWESYDEEHILESLPPFVELTFTSPDGEGMLQTLVVDEDNTNWDANEDGVWDDPVYAWKIGGLWSLMGVKDLTIDHCQVIGGMIDAESITVQNGALLATSYQIEGSVTCGEGISYRGYTYGTYVYGPNEFIITEPINISQYGLATYCSPNNDLNFTEVEDVKAYIATGFNSATNQLTLTRVYNVPAGTGLLLYSASGEAVEGVRIPAESTTNTYENNLFVGCVKDTYIQPTVGEYTNFVLSKHSGEEYLGFYTFTTSNPQGRLIEAGKAYLQIATDQLNIGVGIKGFSLVFDDDPTGIVEIEGGNSKILEDTEIYNLAGQRLNKVQKGINIVNGKKIAVK